jgi:hypothetical protein
MLARLADKKEARKTYPNNILNCCLLEADASNPHERYHALIAFSLPIVRGQCRGYTLRGFPRLHVSDKAGPKVEALLRLICTQMSSPVRIAGTGEQQRLIHGTQ